MELHQIRFFLALSRTRDYARAAEECGVSQSALTSAVEHLSAELGGDVVQLKGGHLHLTGLGKRLLPVLQQCHDNAIAAKEVAELSRKPKSETVRVGVAPTIGLDILAPHLKRLTDAFPEADIQVSRALPADLVEQMKECKLDLAVADWLEESWVTLESWQLSAEQLMVVAHHTHRLATAQSVSVTAFADERLFAPNGCMWHDEIDRRLGDAKTRRKITSSTEDMIALVSAGLGIAIVPASIRPVEGIVELRVSNLDLVRNISLYAIAGRPRPAAVKALIESVRSQDHRSQHSRSINGRSIVASSALPGRRGLQTRNDLAFVR